MDDEKLSFRVGASIIDFTAKMKAVTRQLNSLNKTVTTNVKVKTNQAITRLNKVATALRSVGEVGQSMLMGTLIASFSALIPVIASTGAAIGGLGASFAAAGAGVVGFGAVAIGNLTSVFKASSDIAKAQDEYTKATTAKDRKKALEKEKQAWMGLDSEQKNALKSLQSFKSFWSGFYKAFQSPVLEIFSKSLNALQTTLKLAQPPIAEAARAINGLMDSLNASLKTDDVQTFFNWLGTTAGPAITAFGTAFGNVMRGVMNLLVAFGPLGVDMQNGLVGMTEKFANWTSTLSKSKGFQQFVDYVKTNGPKVLSLIGNLVNLIVNLAVTMAPLGAQVLDIVNKIISWTNSMIKANPQIGKIIGIVITMIGVLKLVGPPILLIQSLFSGLVVGMIKGIAKMIPALSSFAETAALRLMYVGDGIKAVGSKMKTLAITAVTSAKKVTLSLLSMAKKAAVTSAGFIKQVALMGAKYVWLGVQSLLAAAKVAASWLIAMGPIGWITAAVIALVVLIIANWSKIKNWTVKIFKAIWSYATGKFSEMKSAISSKLSSIWNAIKSIWSKVTGFFKGINLYSIGKNIIQGLINGVSHMASSVVDSVKNVVGGAIKGAKKLLGIHSPSRVFMQIGKYTGQGMVIGMDRMSSGVTNAANRMARATIPNVAGIEMPGLSGINIPSASARAGAGGINQTVNIYSPTALSPSEIARKQKQASQRMAMEMGL